MAQVIFSDVTGGFQVNFTLTVFAGVYRSLEIKDGPLVTRYDFHSSPHHRYEGASHLTSEVSYCFYRKGAVAPGATVRAHFSRGKISVDSEGDIEAFVR